MSSSLDMSLLVDKFAGETLQTLRKAMCSHTFFGITQDISHNLQKTHKETYASKVNTLIYRTQ